MTHPHFVLALEASPSISLLHLAKQQAGGQNMSRNQQKSREASKRANQNAPLWQMALFICCGPRGVPKADWLRVGLSQRLCFWVHQVSHHQVNIDNRTQVQGPVEEAVAHKLGDERPQDGEGESLR